MEKNELKELIFEQERKVEDLRREITFLENKLSALNDLLDKEDKNLDILESLLEDDKYHEYREKVEVIKGQISLI